MSRWIAAMLVLAPALTPAAVPTLSFDDVRTGMRGTGRTVFAGTRIETFDVEVVGKLPNVGPGRDLILARLSGEKLAETGVFAGMSGSPVYIEDKLVGAIAFSWAFATKPMAAITPIGPMLAVAEREGTDSPARAPAIGFEDDLARLAEPAAIGPWLARAQASLAPSGAAHALPLSVSGVDAAVARRLLSDWMAAGWIPVQAGGVSGQPGGSVPVEPGSAIAVELVRGDVGISVSGTVTWVDGERVLAFGHPLLGLGSLDLPLAAAQVEAIVPSLHQSARLARPLGVVGALRQDRSAGIYGLLGGRARTIPVRLRLSSDAGRDEQFSFDVAEDPLLSPLLLYVSLSGIVTERERQAGAATLRLREGSVIKMMEGPDVKLDNLFAGPAAFDYGTGMAAYVLHLLMNNVFGPPRIAGVNLLLAYEEAPRMAFVRRVWLDRYRVTAGESVRVSVHLRPYRGPDRTVAHEFTVPPQTAAGPLVLSVGGALEVGRASGLEGDVPPPTTLGELVRLINRLRRNDRLYLVATREAPGFVVGGAPIPEPPPSLEALLTRPRRDGDVRQVARRAVFEDVVPTDAAIEGWARVELEVVRP